MNPPDDRPAAQADPALDLPVELSADLLRATELLRAQTDPGWHAVRGSVLDRALSAFRPSAPVRGRHGLGEYVVAADVVVASLREALTALPGVVPDRIVCATDPADVLEGVTVEIVAGFGHDLLRLADGVRDRVGERLEELLGPMAPDRDRITAHVHVADVSDDPSDRFRGPR